MGKMTVVLHLWPIHHCLILIWLQLATHFITSATAINYIDIQGTLKAAEITSNHTRFKSC